MKEHKLMEQFLESVAKAYNTHYSNISDLCFLFPNKRSATFLLNHLKKLQKCDHAIKLPETMTISDLVTTLAGVDVGNRIDLLFRLYETYVDYCTIENRQKPESLDDFMMWGETLLSDFSEIDLSCVHADDIFKNISNLAELTTDYLTDEQRRLLIRYFGEAPQASDSPYIFDSDQEGSEHIRKFKDLRHIMSPLYHEFSKRLDKAGIATTGSLYRNADEWLKEFVKHQLNVNPADRQRPIRAKKIVAIGFNALTPREISIFSTLKNEFIYKNRTNNNSLETEDYLDFIWDATGPVLNPQGAIMQQRNYEAAKFIKVNREEFPEPKWVMEFLKKSSTNRLPQQIKVISVPGNAQQTKQAGRIIREFVNKNAEENIKLIKRAKVAVVLPDESLLFPMLGSLPEITDHDSPADNPVRVGINLTMGYELKYSAAAAWVKLYRRILHNHTATGYFKADILALLSHPFAQVVLSTPKVALLRREITRHTALRIPESEIIKHLNDSKEIASLIFAPLPHDATPLETISKMDAILEIVERNLRNSPDAENSIMTKGNLDAENTASYRDGLRRLAFTLSRHPSITLTPYRTLDLAERLISPDRVMFEGEPVTGLQVMGMLETRSLDFEHIVICSVNEKSLPKRVKKRTFITQTLRNHFHMPPAGYEESLFAYYFYRLISRAKTVTLIYDSRVGGGLYAGGVSRYVQQLVYQIEPDYLLNPEHEHENHSFIRQHLTFGVSGKFPTDPKIRKKDYVLDKLNELNHGENPSMKLSASALKTYCECQLKFFYKHLMKIVEPQQENLLDDFQRGSVVHYALEQIFQPGKGSHVIDEETPLKVTREWLTKQIEDSARIEELVVEGLKINLMRLNKNNPDFDSTPLNPMFELIVQPLVDDVIRTLKVDLQDPEFEVIGCEVSRKTFPLDVNGRKIDFSLSIDRLDLIDGQLRIVDYKTSGYSMAAQSVDELFAADYKLHNALQMLIYSHVFPQAFPEAFYLKKDSTTGLIPFRCEIHPSKRTSADKKNPAWEVNPEHQYIFLPTPVSGITKSGEPAPTKITSTSDEIEQESRRAPLSVVFADVFNDLIDKIFNNEYFEPSEEGCEQCYLRTICRKE